jgi:hypothetical protein
MPCQSGHNCTLDDVAPNAPDSTRSARFGGLGERLLIGEVSTRSTRFAGER